MESSPRLLIPGPIDLDERVLAALSQPVIPHYGDHWVPLYRRLQDGVRPHAGTAFVHGAQGVLCVGVSLFGGAGVRCDGLNAVHIFFSQDVSLLVQNPLRWVIDSSPYIL